LNDSDGLKKDELSIISGQKSINPNNKNPDIWHNFYEKVKEIKEYHKKFNVANLNIETHGPEWFLETVFDPPFKRPFFTGEENNGKYVDMHHLYLEFINLKKIKDSNEYKIGDYLWYLQHFDQFHEIPYSLKEKEYKKYKRYLKNLVEYLRDFFRRTQPLTDFNIIEKQTKEDFEYRWKEGTVRGWDKKDLADVKNNPLYCSACQKLFNNEHVFVNHFAGKKHQKNSKLVEKNLAAPSNSNNMEVEKDKPSDLTEENNRKLAYLETFAIRLKELLGDIVHDTMNQIRKKQTRTYEEMETEKESRQVIDVDQDDEEDDPVYNPKNLPLGWDGKPIPYWLYKLHGLGIEYKCEICGNYSYWGRRAFERHFQEWRHAYGMKCLRIPNTIHFKEITSINDALALHQKLLLEADIASFKPEVEEEYEDSDGNVLNKKRYLDLKRQGLL